MTELATENGLKCHTCGIALNNSNWSTSWREASRHQCKRCSKSNNDISNNKRMYVNGRYIPQTHPLYKAGRYNSFDAAAFSALENYQNNKGGYVYAITNPAWPGWIKIGMAGDAEDRCISYQTGSPFRDYELVHYVSTHDRRKTEEEVHNAASKIAEERKREWFKMSEQQVKECMDKILTEGKENERTS